MPVASAWLSRGPKPGYLDIRIGQTERKIHSMHFQEGGPQSRLIGVQSLGLGLFDSSPSYQIAIPQGVQRGKKGFG